MDDIDEVIRSAQHMKYAEKGEFRVNLISSLPDTIPHLKKALKERIGILYGAYISLATFIPDEDLAEFKKSKKFRKVTYERIYQNMEKFKEEIKKFDPLGLWKKLSMI